MKRLRVVAYAINGRGAGHLVRQLAILRWIRRITGLLGIATECWILTTSEADTLARREGVPALKMPSKAMLRDAGIPPERYLKVARTWVLNAIAGLEPDLLVVDTFPGGSFGELVAALEMVRHRVLVARRVREEFAAGDPYRALVSLYGRVITPDDSGTGPILIRERAELLARDAARRALGIPEGRRAVYVTLGGGGDPDAAATLPRLVGSLRERAWHVVVGAGPLYGGVEIRGESITWLDRYVPMELFPGVDAAVSAAGYNAFHELMFAGVPTVFLPQPRIADDQTERAARAEAAGAGRIAASIAEVADLLEAPGDAESARRLVPHNGARRAAMLALETVLPAEDLSLVRDLLLPCMGAALPLGRRGTDDAQIVELVRLVSGGTPAERRARRSVLLDLAEQGHVLEVDHAEPSSVDRVSAFLALLDRYDVPVDAAVRLTTALTRKFPAAHPEQLVQGCATLFGTWARFDDWMGAISLLRAIPRQRGYTISSFATDLAAWLAHETDLFDALRAFTHLEQAGSRGVSDVLAHLARRHEAAP